ncbi:cytochrome c biogenesis protein CcsA [Micromonospora sp. NPDC003197]
MRGANRTPLTSGPRAAADRRTLGWATAGLAGAALATGLLIAPPDHVQGDAQRLMYLHVPAAWTAYLAFAAVLVTSIAYLIRRDLRWDRCARAAAEIGVALTALTIVLGAVWGQLVWGTWWAWDPRLVSTVLLLLVYTACLTTRHHTAGGDEPAAHRAAYRAARLGIGGFALVPLVHWSVVWWRSLHQPATVLAPGKPPIELLMGIALLLSVLACTVGASWVFLCRVATLEDQAQDAPEDRAETDRPATRTLARVGRKHR